MFELDIEMLKEQGLQLVDSAKKTAQDLADKGKNKLDLLNQQARLSKAQRQLGALVYSLHKAGEENPALVEKYIDAVAEVEKAIEEIKANMTDDERAEVEAQEDRREHRARGSPRRGRGNRGRTHPAARRDQDLPRLQGRGRRRRPVLQPLWCSAVKYGRTQLLQEKRCQHLTNPAICVK